MLRDVSWAMVTAWLRKRRILPQPTAAARAAHYTSAMQLTPHPSSTIPGGLQLEAGPVVAAGGAGRGVLTLRYRLQGDLAELVVPAAAPPMRRDELWRHSCFELFVAAPAGEAYFEFNFAPSGQWAAYAFSGYREGMHALPMSSAPRIECRRSPRELELTVTLSRADLGRAPAAFVPVPHPIALTAVLEFTGARFAYWALAHPAGRPDFHHRDGFVATLEL
jgi:hypothetical protein